MASLPLRAGESSDSPLSPSYTMLMGQRRVISLPAGGRSSPGFGCNPLTLQGLGGVFITAQQGWRSQIPTQPSLTPSLWACCGPHYSLMRAEAQAPHLLSAREGVVGPYIFLWNLTEVQWPLYISFLSCETVHFLVLWLERSNFSQNIFFFKSAPTGIF